MSGEQIGQGQFTNNPLTPRVCEMLVALERHRNMGEAARELGVLQSVLSRQLVGVENNLGAVLFARTTRSMEPTDAGRALIREATRILASLDRIQVELTAIGRGESGLLRLGVASVAIAVLLPQAIAAFRKKLPGVELAIRDDTGDRLIEDLAVGRIDAAVLRMPKGGHFDFERVVLYDEPIRIVVGRGHPLAGAARVDWADLARYPWILPAHTNPARAQIEAFFARSGMKFEAGILETMSVPLIIGILNATDTVTLVADSLAQRCVRVEGFAILPVACPLDIEPVSVVWRKEKNQPPALAGFIEALTEVARTIDSAPGAGGRQNSSRSAAAVSGAGPAIVREGK